ncbi:hypothetical protein DFJ58DRAFT_863494 [Suillus subalutaceus]|uniref:uncharacterized protein n=1 Tax=Suillus subalutaceus TaxID=48586 RepID=UPI001B86B4B1|nr:uncharacterized protein DFJ58DRAFT_863494 [Suillus subalutaceus]KAG1865841.1 hypothetical protein DFJ58DRAFT_863494 [Suillus subalutaceus]
MTTEINNNASTSSQAQSSGSITGSGGPGNMSQTDANGLAASQQSLAKKCFDYIEDYRCSQITKLEANIILIEIISAECFNTSSKVITVAGPYISMLAQIETPQPEKTPNTEIRSREGSNEPGEPARKRPKLNYSSIAHSVRTRQYKPLSANLERTNEILANWLQDQKEVRRYLMYHKYGPEFHESRWAEIFAGKYINLDVMETLGEVEIRYGASESASKKISTDSNWFSAWNKAADAIKFAFPHWEAELNSYFTYISTYFSQANPSAHRRVICFDKAVRNRVGTSHRLEAHRPS